jgi:hypothetical protein
MTGLEWFNGRRKSALVPHYMFPGHKVGFAVSDPREDGVFDDVSPMPTDQAYFLVVVVCDGKAAYYWMPEVWMDDASVDIWALMLPSIHEQLGIADYIDTGV